MPTKAVIYARYSSQNQNEQSIEGQLHECMAYAQSHDLVVVDTYIDRAMTGTNDQRESFQRMIQDSDKRLFEAVIVYKLDRFTRNRYDAAIYKSRLRKNGVKVIYAKESIPDGPEGIILESLLEGMAEYYSAELSQKLRRGMRENALKCLSTGGNVALGFKVMPDKSFAIDPSGAALVRQIFEFYDRGKTISEIVRILNANGFTTTRGKKYSYHAVYCILKNERYTGTYICKDIRIENGLPVIIPKDLFIRVQNKMEATAKFYNRKESTTAKYYLSGKVFCGECGSNLSGKSGHGKSGTAYHYYRCKNSHRGGSCALPPIPKSILEKAVVNATIENVLRPENIEYISRRCVEISKAESEDNSELSLLTSRLSEVKKGISNLMQAIESGIISRHTQTRLQELEDQEAKLEYEISILKNKSPVLTEEQVVFMLTQFCESIPGESYLERIIEAFVHSVYVYSDRLVITYTIGNTDNTLTKETIDFAARCSTDISDSAPCAGSPKVVSPPPSLTLGEQPPVIYFYKGWLLLSVNYIR